MGKLKFMYPTSSRSISAGFPNYSSGKYHGGIDFPVAEGTPVRASESGKIIIKKELNYSYGHYLKIDHGSGYQSLYAHNSRLLVNLGDYVTQGQVIAYSGSTGNSTGPHLHFEIWYNNARVNPLKYLDSTITVDGSAGEREDLINDLNRTIDILEYKGKGHVIYKSDFLDIKYEPELKTNRFTVCNGEEFNFLGRIKGKDIFYISVNKGGYSEGRGFVEGKYLSGGGYSTGRTITINVPQYLNKQDWDKLNGK